ncbi:MFS transporter [Brachybacterium endophyticum]|uniref:MFS transporter n=1 Tax=Brachybacterium endophyticum TaxID=2182385 RepID=A0A2U2RMY1_9MICO|nr:MFS transporter [Brachybacterium endophyticum]PWH07191.1 MFS transporter [Brachybacterium endophyticum]
MTTTSSRHRESGPADADQRPSAGHVSAADPVTRAEQLAFSPAVESATRKARWRLLPFLMLMFVIAFIDRSNIGFAEDSLEVHAGLGTAAYAFGAGLFFIGYAVFEVPSNLIMHRVGARWWMARIMVTWGIVAALFMVTTGPVMFYVLRFLLGVAEAGFFPGVILYLTYWFPRRTRGQATALFYLGLPIANIVGSPLSGALLELDGALGLHGFQWMFLIEGLLAVLVGVAAVFVLTDRPSRARWLTETERTSLEDVLAAEAAGKQQVAKLSWWQSLLTPRVLYFALIYLTIQVAVYGLTFFLPAQVASITGREVGFLVGLLVAIPWLCALVVNLFVGRWADRRAAYRSTATLMLVLSGIGLAASAFLSEPVLAMAALCLAAIGFVSAQPIFWNIPTGYLSGAAMAAGVGLINGLGNLGGFIAPNLRSWMVTAFDSQAAGLVMLAAAPFLGALLVAGTALFERRDRAARAGSDAPTP